MRFGEFASLPHAFELLDAFCMGVEELPHHSDTVLDLGIEVIAGGGAVNDAVMRFRRDRPPGAEIKFIAEKSECSAESTLQLRLNRRELIDHLAAELITYS